MNTWICIPCNIAPITYPAKFDFSKEYNSRGIRGALGLLDQVADITQMCTSGGRSSGGRGDQDNGNNLGALEAVKGFTRLFICSLLNEGLSEHPKIRVNNETNVYLLGCIAEIKGREQRNHDVRVHMQGIVKHFKASKVPKFHEVFS